MLRGFPLLALLMLRLSGEDTGEYPPADDRFRSDIGAYLVHAAPTINDPDVANGQGLAVVQILDKSTARNLSLQEGDILLEVNGTPLFRFDHLLDEFGNMVPGDPVSATIIRNGVHLQISGIAQPAVRPIIHRSQKLREFEEQSIEQNRILGDQLKSFQALALRQSLNEIERQLKRNDDLSSAGQRPWSLEIVIQLRSDGMTSEQGK